MDDNRRNMLAIGHMTLKVSRAKNLLRLATTQKDHTISQHIHVHRQYNSSFNE